MKIMRGDRILVVGTALEMESLLMNVLFRLCCDSRNLFALAIAVAVIGLPLVLVDSAAATPQAPSSGSDPFDDPFEDPLNEPAANPGGTPLQGGVPSSGSGLDDARATARNAMRSRNWRQAIDAWTSVLAIDKNDAEAKSGLKAAQAALDQASTIDTVQEDFNLRRQRATVQFNDDMAGANG